MIKINVGCGGDYLPGYVNVDVDPAIKADLYCDINVHLPYPSNSVDFIKAFDILEHLDVRGVKEIYRVLRVGGLLYIRVPHYLCRNAYSDFTHSHYFNSITLHNSVFRVFDVVYQKVWYSFADHYITFTLPPWLCNLHERCLPGVLPPSHIICKLRKR